MGISELSAVRNAEESKIASKFYDGLGFLALEVQAKKQRQHKDLDFLLQLISPNDKVLELGCGYGRVLIPLLQQGVNISGLDISAVLLAQAQQSLQEAELDAVLVESCMSNTPFENESFNLIFCIWSGFSHLLSTESQISCLNEIYRLLAPKGKAIIEVIDGARKHNQQKIAESGYGYKKKLVKATASGQEFVVFLHDKETLIEICNASLFDNFSVKFKQICGKRKIIVSLLKK